MGCENLRTVESDSSAPRTGTKMWEEVMMYWKGDRKLGLVNPKVIFQVISAASICSAF